jgi:hypothetical protein
LSEASIGGGDTLWEVITMIISVVHTRASV